MITREIQQLAWDVQNEFDRMPTLTGWEYRSIQCPECDEIFEEGIPPLASEDFQKWEKRVRNQLEQLIHKLGH